MQIGLIVKSSELSHLQRGILIPSPFTDCYSSKTIFPRRMRCRRGVDVWRLWHQWDKKRFKYCILLGAHPLPLVYDTDAWSAEM